ncbi:MAG: MarR family transcriptional regulator [Pseudonocardia sp.]|nr:MarR family transcriptional regulator [Pseudonocardia sp.]
MELRELFSDLIRFETELWNAVDERLRVEVGLPLSRFEPLQVIDRLGACRVHDIARELSITAGGVSKLVDRTESAGLCRRRANPVDGRSSIIELTAAGRRVLTSALEVFDNELQTQLGSALPEAELEHFGRTLARLRAHRSHLASSKLLAGSVAQLTDRVAVEGSNR